MPIIELKDVSKLYGFGDATTVALEEVSLTISEREFVAVMGPSGCGKSTLMNLIGLLDRPTHGEYSMQGRPVERLRANQRAKIRRDTVGFVFQSFNLLPRLTVIENIALPLVYKGISPAKRIKRAADMLERVGLSDREYFYPRHLSGGQAQCAAIARALINDPKIIIADEPTGNLDSANSRLVMELLSEIHQTGQSTILFVTHNPELTRYATRVVYMHDGSIVHDEPTAIGEIAKTARRVMFSAPAKTEEDDLAGVSVLMKALPAKDETKTPEPDEKEKKNQKKSRKSYKRKSKRSAKK